jgi:uncharacterized protein YhfF
MKTALTDEIWQAYCLHAKINDQDYEVVAFGDSPEMADELGHLIVNGPKRATAGLYRDFESDLSTLPKVGGHVVVIDGRGQPLCVFQSTDVRVGPLNSIDDQFAWDEGEGDRTRAWWLNAHTAFFTRQATREGFTFTPDIPTVFERFKIVWPPSIADT